MDQEQRDALASCVGLAYRQLHATGDPDPVFMLQLVGL